MAIQLDPPSAAIDAVLNTGLAKHLRYAASLGLEEMVSVSRPIQRQAFVLSISDTSALSVQRSRSWDYVVVKNEAVAIAAVRDRRTGLEFEGLYGGETARRVIAAIHFLCHEFNGQRDRYVLRLFDCRPARLLSATLSSRSGPGYFVNILDNNLIAADAVVISENLSVLKTLAVERIRERRTAPSHYF